MKKILFPNPPAYARIAIASCASIALLILALNVAVILGGAVIHGFGFLSRYLDPQSQLSLLGGIVSLQNFKAAFLYVVVLIIALGLMGYDIKNINRVWRVR
ncbi:hypothetical protein [Larkinella rosea]|uniref:Uncharacterized protein n=1 Tax=Larkinella rosea TaxID=2025312 RepID=A0A3P1BSM1_9BACT|nr:hypothetical protein [Larkinella rosea]RRB04110.1 hypothetical protein EHT25_11335 [Larkinella rosea]